MKNMFASLLRHGPAMRPARTLGAPTVWRLVGCYAVATAFVLGIDRVAPLDDSGARRVWSLWAEGLVSGTSTGALGVPVWVDTLLALAAAFVLTVPIVIIYVRTRTHTAFDDSLANTVLVLPAIVTAILIVVHNSLAMAFSLAGIVAAVRFRISLKESRDALYIFAAIAIGFAAGIYALDVGLIASVVFVLLETLTWRTDLGADQTPADDMLDDMLKEKAKDKGKDKPQHADAEEADPAARDVLLRIKVADVDGGRRAVEPLLEELTKTWHRVAGGGSPVGVLEYEVRLRKRHPADDVRTRLLRDAQPFVVSVEVSPSAARAAPTTFTTES